MKHIYYILLIVLVKNSALSCECHSISHKFMDKMEDYNFVGLIQVMGQDTVNWHLDLGYKKEFLLSDTYSRVKIIQQYKGDQIGLVTLIRNGKGIHCDDSLGSPKNGEKYLIKGFIGKQEEDLVSDLDEDIRMIHLSICDNIKLKVVNNEVKGWVTKYPAHKYAKWSKFWRTISFGIIKRKGKLESDFKKQVFKFDEIDELLKRKLSSVTNIR